MNRTTETHDEINVMGPKAKLDKLVERFDAKISDRYADDDINIVVKREQCDDVTNWCDNNDVAWRLL